MKIFDMHIHSFKGEPNPNKLIDEMNQAGIYGGMIISNMPKESNTETGSTFEERLEEALAWTKGFKDRLFPVLWVHPYEENIIEKVHIAVDAGIMAFKVICANFYVYEEKSLELIREIAKLNKPIMFHTGILWDGLVSSNYNRPMNWEALLHIEGLRFSMGHCSWPWIDECIAMYGKFLDAKRRGQNTAEMYFDITPGTPDIYRHELFYKMFNIGYDVKNNILFGTDLTAHRYLTRWAQRMLNLEGKIMDELGVSKACRENIYHNNLFRFLGIPDTTVDATVPEHGSSNATSVINPEVVDIIKKWYKKLNIPSDYDGEFQLALAKYKISDAVTVESFGVGSTDGARNLLTYLYLCESLSQKYQDKGIPESILLDTLSDIVRWLDIHSDIKKTMYLGEMVWLKRHMSMQLFKIGRLEFCPGRCGIDIPKYNLTKQDNVIEVHIPSGEKLTREECANSLNMARAFFAKYFPEYAYTCFTCDSWLLDSALVHLLKADSNIIRFRDMFDVVSEKKSDNILKYVFRWDIKARNLRNEVAPNSFAQRVKDYILGGGEFHEAFGVIAK